MSPPNRTMQMHTVENLVNKNATKTKIMCCGGKIGSGY
jgi:hypothetical protein